MTLVEVIVGSLILAITFAGLLATFIGVRKYTKRANKRLIATDLVSQTLSDLYKYVDNDTWNTTGELRTGTRAIGSYTIDGLVYEGTSPDPVNQFSVITVGDYRRVSVTVNYP